MPRQYRPGQLRSPKVDPQAAHDMLGEPINDGDFVTYLYSRASSSNDIGIAQVLSVRYKRYHPSAGRYGGGGWVNCPPPLAERWTLWVQPWVTSRYSAPRFIRNAEGLWEPDPATTGRGTTIQRVENCLCIPAEKVQSIIESRVAR